ncbi:MAG TPA: ABC transporter substrate-binding protein [Stellaceae bacterium]|nr:ABC transporter substrate-binding protein [Stellaceae bacterium]
MKRYWFAALLVALLMATGSARAEDKLKIGFLTTLSWPGTTNGQEILDAFNLALDETGETLGGRPVDLVVGDDVNRPDLGLQLVRRMIQQDKVDLFTGFVGSNVTIAAANVILPTGMPMLILNGGPSTLAGAGCRPNLFDAAFQSDTPAEAMAIYLQNRGAKSVFLVTQNWQPGRDAVAGFKRYYKGQIAGEIYTPLDNFDYAADLAEIRAAKADAMYFFFTGGAPVINFVKQLAEAGLKGQMGLYTQTNPLDDQTLPGIGDAALGIESSGQWNEDLDNPANRAFVAHFRAKYHRRPSITAANAYDGARLLDAALHETGGKVTPADAFRHALATVHFDSVRGSFRLNTNHFPIQSFYLSKVEKDASGTLGNRLESTIVKDLADSYVGACKME